MTSEAVAPAATARVERPVRGSDVRLYYRVCRYFCRLGFVGAFRGRVFHAERVPRTGGVLLACNHQSFLDPVLAALSLPRECHFMGRDTLFEKPAFRRLIESLNCFPIKRNTADLRAIKESLRRLRGGAAIVTFPEGTRTPDGEVHELQAGAVLIARKAGVPIIPTVIAGAYEVFPRHQKLPRFGRIIVAYGEALLPAQMEQWPDETCVGEVQRRVVEMYARYRPLLRS